MVINENDLILSFYKVLLYNITDHTMQIFAKVCDDALHIGVVMSISPTEDVKDIYFSVCGEVVGDFIGLDLSRSQVNFFTGSAPPRYRDGSWITMFARCDLLDSQSNLKG